MSAFFERLNENHESAQEALFDNHTDVFWVDWKEPDDILADYCENIIQSGKLSSDLDDAGLQIQYGGNLLRVPLTYSGKDRHITLLALNEVMSGKYEIRFVWASDGGDTLAFAPLSAQDWMGLEAQFGVESVDRTFMKLKDFPNVFTDPLGPHDPKKLSKPW